MNKVFQPRWVTVFCAIALMTAHLSAQVNATGTFSGQVTDAAGAAVPGAQVKITEQTEGVSTSRTTGADGIYTVPFLKPGVYSVEVAAKGFNREIAKDLTLQINQIVQQDFKLQVGGVQQEVTVVGGAPLLSTESTEIGTVVTQETAQQLPLNGRNFSQLMLLSPGTT